MTAARKDLFAFLGLLGLLIIFFPELVWVQSAPLTGDHLDQHYPWAFLLAQSIHSFHLPLWSQGLHSGFPIAAEGQIAIFYLPNLVLFFLLPFKMAYSYINLLHWLIAGWGTYLYAKQLRLSPFPAFVAALIFVFGAAYGGAFYNITSLKTIAWFPLGLWLFEKYIESGRWRFLFALAFLVSQSLIAGYLQMAVLTWMVFAIYGTLRIFCFPNKPVSGLKRIQIYGALLISGLLALFFSAPQIYLTFQLAMESNRTALAEGYAYVGSLSPLAFGTLIDPYFSLMLRGNNLYAGLLGLFFIFLSKGYSNSNEKNFFRLWIVMALLILLLALGRWSPLYVTIIKLTRFYAFRVPAKFIVFVCFGMAILAGMGFHQLWNGALSEAFRKKAARLFFSVTGGFFFILILFNLLLTKGRGWLNQLGEYYVRHYVYGQPGHPHSLETYLEGVKAYPDFLVKYFEWQNPQNLWFLFIASASSLMVYFFTKKRPSKNLFIIGIVVLLVDLYGLSYIDIRLDFSKYESLFKPTPVLQALEAEKSLGHVSKIYGYRAFGERLPLVPSQNMLLDIADIGAYSPFVISRYFQSIGRLGNINDSNIQASPAPEYVIDRLPLLNFLDVSHILSTQVLTVPSLKMLAKQEAPVSYLYENTSPHQPAYFTTKLELCESWEDLQEKLMAPQFDPAKILLLEKNELEKIDYSEKISLEQTQATVSLLQRSDEAETWIVESNQAGFLIVSETYFKGWKAWVDNQSSPILKAHGLFRGIWLKSPGKHQVQFRYQPFQTKDS